MRIFYQLEQRNNKNNIKYKSKKIQAKSFVKTFIYSLYSRLSGLPFTTNDITNTSRTYTLASSYYGNLYFMYTDGLGSGENIIQKRIYYGSYSSGQYWLSLNITSTTTGIVIGTSNTVVTATDYALTTRILSGKSAGQIEYFGHTFTTKIVSAPNASYTQSRIFRNSSGGNIIIKEIGIYGYSGYFSYCHIRDVLGTPVTMSNGDYLKITYTFQITA
jgi:hypothetical protein